MYTLSVIIKLAVCWVHAVIGVSCVLPRLLPCVSIFLFIYCYILLQPFNIPMGILST